ncbi:MAG: FtsX-like permease family protein, partial [Bacteroidota bacterium]|nr:FtsX-like permease family protein [Bacteroidota bacterium]
HVLYSVGFTSILAIVIASLGLYGMATYSTQTRLKEIGVRKVYGANTRDIVNIILKSYLSMVLIAALIAGPLGYLVNNLWLQYLALHVSFGPVTILIGVLIVVTIAFLTITTQTLKAANTNPARILKHE